MRISFFAGLALVTLGAAFAAAAPPVNADPQADLQVTPAAGKWMVLAASYVGDESGSLARQLALKIRQRDNLPAYTFSRYEEEQRQLQENERKLREMYPGLPNRRPHVRTEEQWAVVIGGWPDMESASAALKKIKQLPMHDLRRSDNKPAYDLRIMPKDPNKDSGFKAAVNNSNSNPLQNTNALMDPNQFWEKGNVVAVPVNPLANAFVIRNPTVPPDPKPTTSWDPNWEKMNSYEDYSLLKSRKPWTLVVKEYRGAAALVSQSATGSFLDSLWGKKDDTLTAAGKQAHEVARLLRSMNFEAYVFHTKTASVVTVGGFDSQDDPRMVQTAEQIARLKFTSGQSGGNPILEFLPRPLAMEVPHK